jgi:DNA-binding XRE family transcriptional regulator
VYTKFVAIPLSNPAQNYVLYRALVGRVIATHRAKSNMQQPDLAACLGIAQASLSRIETGHATASIEQLAMAADVFRTTPAALLAEADRAARIMGAQGWKVVRNSGEAPPDWKPLGAVVLAGLLLALALSSSS